MKDISVNIGGQEICLHVQGETRLGADEVLLQQDDNLIATRPWADCGYSVEAFMKDDGSLYRTCVQGLSRIVRGIVEKAKGSSCGEFPIEEYHHFIRSNEEHLALVNQSREGFPLSQFPIDLSLLERRVSEICGVEVSAINPRVEKQVFFLRIIRPDGKPDNNPPHRDVWLDYYRHGVNIYVPVAGSDSNSSLPLVPGSHLWKESEIERTVSGAKIDGIGYRVPSVTKAKEDLKMVRPDPRANEMMVFSPYLVHGGGVNLNRDRTRVSLEMRFFRKQSALPSHSLPSSDDR